jgi:choline kinase
MQEVPKALLPVANRPVLSYVLEQLELSNLKDLIVVCFSLFFFLFEIPYYLFACSVLLSLLVEEKGKRRRKTEIEKAASILEYSFIILNPINK